MVRSTDPLDMTIVVDWDVKPQIKQKLIFGRCNFENCLKTVFKRNFNILNVFSPMDNNVNSCMETLLKLLFYYLSLPKIAYFFSSP